MIEKYNNHRILLENQGGDNPARWFYWNRRIGYSIGFKGISGWS